MKKILIKLVTGLIPVKQYRKALREKLLAKFYCSKNSEIISINPERTPASPKLNNKILLIENGIEKEVPVDFFQGLKIILHGENCELRIYSPYRFGTSVINIWSGAKFELKSSKYAIHSTQFYIGADAIMSIGENFSCNGALIANNVSTNFLTIGNDCMFSRNITVRADDGHVICKKGSRQVINNSEGTKIGNHVWVGERAFIGKNVEVADGCIVAACAVLTKGSSEENVIYAGVPAKIIKRDIEWYRENHNAFSTI